MIILAQVAKVVSSKFVLYFLFFSEKQLLQRYKMASTQIYISLLLVSFFVALGKIDVIIQ